MKTKPKKKAPAKKSAPKVKLIEGKYSHKFLTRLEPQAGSIFEEIKKILNEKTFNGSINKLIKAYQPLIKQLNETQKELSQAKQQMNATGNLLMALKQNFKAIQDLKLIDIAFNEEEEDDDDICEYCEGFKIRGKCPDCD